MNCLECGYVSAKYGKFSWLLPWMGICQMLNMEHLVGCIITVVQLPWMGICQMLNMEHLVGCIITVVQLPWMGICQILNMENLAV